MLLRKPSAESMHRFLTKQAVLDISYSDAHNDASRHLTTHPDLWVAGG
jgi:hypothetical protein